TVKVYGIGPLPEGKGLEQVMRDQMTYSYFPVENTMLDDVVQYYDFNTMFRDGVEKSFEPAPGVSVRIKLTDDPVYCAAYRIEADGKSFIFTGDHEPWPEEQQEKAGDTMQLYR